MPFGRGRNPLFIGEETRFYHSLFERARDACGRTEALSSLPPLPNIEMHFKEPSTLVIVASDVRASEPVQPKFARPSFQSTLPRRRD